MTPPADLADPGLYADTDGLAVLGALQRETPVRWIESDRVKGFWAVTGYPEAVAVYLDRISFTSEQGMQVGQNEGAALTAAGKMLIVTDNPRHRILRRIIAPLLSPQAMERLREPMGALLAKVLGALAGRPSFDFVSEVAALLPSFAICEILGVPEADRVEVVALTRTAFGSTTETRPVTDAEKMAANADLFDYFGDLLKARRRAPGGDVISLMATREIDGERLTDDDIILNIHGLITGGNETTRHASTGAVLAFADFPKEWRRLRADPAIVPAAVEEVLRWTAPSLNVMRTCTNDTDLCGRRISPGDRVAIWAPIANRDPRAFEAADRFVADRTPNKHLTFGLGHHLCVGAALARLELSVLLHALLKSVGSFQRTGPVKRLHSNLMWGVDRAPIRMAPG